VGRHFFVTVSETGSVSGSEDIVLAVRGLTKRFNQQVALSSVDLTLYRGEIHGLVGENGSGKSTLIKILAGFHRPDAGTLELAGVRTPFPTKPGEFHQLGFAFVHQDLGLFLDLTVAENLALTELACGNGGWYLPPRQLVAQADRLLQRFQVSLDSRVMVGSLPPVERAMLAIVRAVVSLEGVSSAPNRPKILVLDEPTVFLPRKDVNRLFSLTRRIADDGAAIIFVSHDPDEVREVCQTITVLRDGRVAGSEKTENVSVSQIIKLIVGRDVVPTRDARPKDLTEVGVDITDLVGDSIHSLDFTIGLGEIVGVTGLAGSGFTELPYLIYGARPARAGQLRLSETSIDLVRLRPREAVRHGMVLVPGDRRRDGIIGALSVTDNVTLPRLGHFVRCGLLRRKELVEETATLMDRFDVRPRNPQLAHGILSGGNQQKAVLAKWLSMTPRLVMLDEPTQGVDVGAREQIFAALRSSAADGGCVLVASSDAEQLALLCHRVLVFRDGTVTKALEGDEVTKEQITDACFANGNVAGVGSLVGSSAWG